MRNAYLQLHLAVLLFGFTAILGRVISISAVSLVWWRVLLASLGMLLIVRIGKTFRTLPRKRILQYLGIGAIVALHWITFFASVKVSNASVALVSFATATFFTALIEPMILKEKHIRADILLGIFIIPVMMMIVRGLDPGMHLGIWLGLVSALLQAVFASLNKKLITHARPLQIAFFEMSGAWLFISFCLGILALSGLGKESFAGMDPTLYLPKGWDWFYLTLLALLCTTLAYVLAVRALHHLSAFASNLVINLEPVYGIALAWVLLKENRELTMSFYVGVLMLLIIVFAYPFLKKSLNPKSITAHHDKPVV